MTPQGLASKAVERLKSVRAQTLQLFDFATSDAVLRSEPMPGFRPLLWHLAHIGVFQNYWLLQRCAGQPSINPRYDIYFDPIKTPREEARRLPDRSEIEGYLDSTFTAVQAFLDRADGAHTQLEGDLSPSYAVDLVFEHESQHQETIAFIFQALPSTAKKAGPPPPRGSRRSAAAEIFIPALQAHIGAGGAAFAYDNERPRHAVELPAFYIDADLTTNAEYAEFVEAGGYERPRLWSSDGWAWKTSALVDRPLSWSQPGGEQGFFADTQRREDAPVTGICWHEACAYASFRGKRLPSEEEWEAAASLGPASGQTSGDGLGENGCRDFIDGLRTTWGSSPVGTREAFSGAAAMRDVTANLWQWTSSAFLGYPGFVAHPYPEYSQAWFDGDHYVARGGSWFTSPALARPSFRNFYRRHFRHAFIGIRCARDAR